MLRPGFDIALRFGFVYWLLVVRTSPGQKSLYSRHGVYVVREAFARTRETVTRLVGRSKAENALPKSGFPKTNKPYTLCSGVDARILPSSQASTRAQWWGQLALLLSVPARKFEAHPATCVIHMEHTLRR